MKKKFYASLIALVLLTGSVVSSVAQTGKAANAKTPKTTGELLSSLPASDGVISIDMQRLLNEFLPRVLADDQAKLAEVNARLDLIKTRTGIDVRAFERVAVGMRFINPAPDKINVESVALARGRFNAPAMLAAGLLAAKDKYKYQEQKYGGKTIYVFNSDELFGKDELPQVSVDEETKKKAGKAAKVFEDLLQKVMNFKAGEVGVVALDGNTLAIGQPANVRAAIDASAGRGRVSAALTQLATRAPNAVLGFGVNAPAKVSRYFGFDDDQIAKNLDAIRQLYGSVGATTGGFELQTFARTENAGQAQDVLNMLIGFRDLGGFFASNLSGDKGKLAKTALENVKLTKEGTEVQIRLELAQSDVAMLVRVF